MDLWITAKHILLYCLCSDCIGDTTILKNFRLSWVWNMLCGKHNLWSFVVNKICESDPVPVQNKSQFSQCCSIQHHSYCTDTTSRVSVRYCNVYISREIKRIRNNISTWIFFRYGEKANHGEGKLVSVEMCSGIFYKNVLCQVSNQDLVYVKYGFSI